MTQSLADLRRDYSLAALTEQSVAPDPFKQFGRWWHEAVSAQLPEPNAMTLATVAPDGAPAARIVLLKSFDDQGFVFYTNYQSAKGRQLAANPRAALVFLWKELERQVRIEGTVSQTSRAQAEAYFNTRPRASRIGALASQQSASVANREILDARFRELDARHPDDAIPMPEYWGGYCVAPALFEFWQGRSGRLHDRLCYRRAAGRWLIERLQP